MMDFQVSPEQAETKHLGALNNGLDGVAHPFTQTDLRMHGKPEDTSPLVETTHAIQIGSDWKLATIKARFPKGDGTFNTAVFTPLFMDEKTFTEKGVAMIVEAKNSDVLPTMKEEAVGAKPGKSKKQIELKDALLDAASQFPNMQYKVPNIPDMVDFKLHDVNPGRFVVLEVTNTEGKVFPVAINIQDRRTGNEGHIFAARFPASGDFQFALQPKPIVGDIKVGPPQGFASIVDDPNSDLMRGLAEEFGLDRVTRSMSIWLINEDFRACFVRDRFIDLNLNLRDEEKMAKPDLDQDMRVQLDKLGKIRMTREEVLDAVKNGKVDAAHSLTGIALSMLNRGEVTLNPKIDVVKNGLVLSIVKPDLDPTRSRISLPFGSTSIGERIGRVHVDATKFRDETPIHVSNARDLSSGRYVFSSFSEIFNELRASNMEGKFGVTETAVIFKYMLQKDILIPNF